MNLGKKVVMSGDSDWLLKFFAWVCGSWIENKKYIIKGKKII